jgi:hypothetical protein
VAGTMNNETDTQARNGLSASIFPGFRGSCFKIRLNPRPSASRRSSFRQSRLSSLDNVVSGRYIRCFCDHTPN